MSVKRAFFSIFQKIMVICCAIFFGFSNAFSANLPSGYTELEYIESTGTQYIDTGFSPDANTSVDWKGQLISGTSGVLLGARVGGSNPGRFFPFAFSTGTLYRTTYGANDVNVSADTSTVCTGSFRPSESKSIINGTTYSFVSPNFSKTESNNLLLFGVSGYGDLHYLSTGKIWYVKIWDNNTLVRDLVPAKNSSGVVGMYDTVVNRFYTNAGTGTFTAGPVVLDPCRNLFDQSIFNTDVGTSIRYTTFPIANGTYTISTDFPRDGSITNVFVFAGTTTSGASSADNGVSASTPRTITVTDGHYTIAYRSNVTTNPNNPKNFNWQLESGSTATAYVPYSVGCHNTNAIKIATTAYNAARFNQVKTDLDSAVATIREIVTKTINQTAAIASLQADKQTRPEDACPAGKKCLLVEDNNGKPHWYEIIENIYGLPTGYTPLEYIQATGTQYIDTGVVFSSGSLKFEADVYTTINISAEEDFIGNFTETSISAGFVGGFAGVTFLYSSSPNINVPRIKQNSWQKYIGEFTNSNQMILTYDGTTVSATRTKQHNSSPIVLFRGSENYKPATHIRLGIVSIYLNNTMVRNFVPAKRDSDGAIGMYDLTNLNPATAFYTNSGTGTFTAGPEM